MIWGIAERYDARLAVRLMVIHDGRDQVAGAVAVFTPDEDETKPALYRL